MDDEYVGEPRALEEMSLMRSGETERNVCQKGNRSF
jgi:hypothetical protein